MDYLEKRLDDYDRLMFDNSIFQKRTQGIAKIDPEKAIEWGVVGPPLRACGIKHDVRIDEPYEAYDKVDFVVPDMYTDGDVWARALVRRFEIRQSINIVRQVLDKMPSGEVYNKIPNPHKWKLPKGDAYAKIESNRGEIAFYGVSDGSENPRRMHARGAAYAHGITLLEDLLVGQNIADVALIMNSLGTCPPEIER